jgi:hypothetical protein
MPKKDRPISYEAILMAAGSLEHHSDCILMPTEKTRGRLEAMVGKGYFRRVDQGAGLVGYALTDKGWEESKQCWEKHKDLRDLLIIL